MRGIATLAAVSLLTFATSWGYDSASRLVSMSYPTGLTLNYAYDGYGRLSTVTSNLGGAWATLGDSFLYQPATQRRYGWRLGNGLPRLVTLDTNGRVTQLASGSAHSLSYAYTNVDTVLSRTDNAYPSQSASYVHDTVDRLTTVSSSNDA